MKQNKLNKIRNYHSVIGVVEDVAIITFAVDVAQVEWLQNENDINHVAIDYNGLRVHAYLCFPESDSIRSIIMFGDIANALLDHLDADLPIFMELTNE